MPDPDYQAEFDAAAEVGFACEVYNLDELRSGDVTAALRPCANSEVEGQVILHRGWMMSDSHYAALCQEVLHKGYRMTVTPEAYRQAHYLPNAYPLIEGQTPVSKWMLGSDMAEAWKLYQDFIQEDAIVKDFVKSAKHRWDEACFIAAHTTQQRFEQIVNGLLTARGAFFEKGIVLRRYHTLATTAGSERGVKEHRLFFWDGKLLITAAPNDETGFFERVPTWENIAKRFDNRFISIDVAQQLDGSWIIIEVGDGGVSGLPEAISPKDFYQRLRQAIKPDAE